jgi:hypothetical protein
MRVKLTALGAATIDSGLEPDRNYTVHSGPDPDGRVVVFDDHTSGFRTLGPVQYREVPDPLAPHDLLRIARQPDGYWALCRCVWRHWQPVADPDEAAHSHQRHLRHMAIDRQHLTTPVHPLLQQWINDRQQRQPRQEPER